MGFVGKNKRALLIKGFARFLYIKYIMLLDVIKVKVVFEIMGRPSSYSISKTTLQVSNNL